MRNQKHEIIKVLTRKRMWNQIRTQKIKVWTRNRMKNRMKNWMKGWENERMNEKAIVKLNEKLKKKK